MSLTFYLESHKYEGRYMYVSCTQTSDILTNTSKINWTLVSTGGEATYYATGPTVLKINGQQVFYAEMMGWSARKFPTAKGSVSGTVTIPHNDDGTKSIEVLLSTAIYTEEVKEQKATWELNKIDRFAIIKTAPDFNDEENPTITYSNPTGENVGSLQVCISLDGSKDDIAYRNDVSKTGSSYTFNLTEAERNVLRAATTGSNSRTVVFFVRSSIDGNIKHSTLNRTLTIVNANPTLSPTVVDTNSKTSRVTGDDKILVALHSTADVKLNAVAKKSATIASRKIEHGNQVLTNDGSLSVTNNPIRFTVVDSRGNPTTQYATNTIVPYFNPTCSIGNNLPEADGSFELEATGLFYKGEIGKTTNALTVQYRYKTAGGSYGSWLSFGTVTKSGNGYTAKASLTGLDYQTVYTFQAKAIDSINTDGVASAEKSVISEPVFHWGQNDFMFNVPVNMKTGCDIMKNGEVAYAPSGYGFGGAPVVVSNNQLNSEADLDTALESIYSEMGFLETKLVKFYGYPSNSDYNWFGLLSKSSDNYGSLIIHSAYDKGAFFVKAKYNGTWQPVKSFSPSNFAPAGYGLGDIAPKTSITTTAQLDGCRTCGFYRYAITGSRICNISFNYGSLLVYPIYTDGCVQEVRPMNSNYCLRRFYFGTTWSEWELVGQVFEKVWQNASPTSNFAAQTISLDLTKYSAVYVEAVRSIDDQTISGTAFVTVGGFACYLMGSTDQFALTRRSVYARSNGVTFTGFNSANTTNGTSNEIPYKIYGIKGVLL